MGEQLVGPLSRDYGKHTWNFHIRRVIVGNKYYVAIATNQINNSHVNDIPLHIGGHKILAESYNGLPNMIFFALLMQTVAFQWQ